MSYTLGQAPRAVGRSKPTIARAIKSGKLSASRGEAGEYVIDESELARAYPVTGNGAGTMKQLVAGETAGTSLAELRVERDRLLIEREDLRETIRDLRHRLDAEAEERRRVQERLTGLLTHRQAGTVPAAGSLSFTGTRVPWWRRLW